MTNVFLSVARAVRASAALALCASVMAVYGPMTATVVYAQAGSPLSVDRIFKNGEFFSASLPETHWLRDGVSFIDMRQGSAGEREIVRIDAVTGKSVILVPASALVVNGKRLAVEDLILSEDESKALLFHSSERVWRQNTKGQYAVVDFATKHVTPVSANTGAKMFAKFSPDAKQVAYVRDNDLYMWDLAANTERRLTSDGNANIINGTSDWVYEEEFGVRDAFRWSPDGARIAFWRFDQSAEPVMTLENLTDSLYPILSRYKYPKAGQPNATVKIGVVTVTNGMMQWINTGSDSTVYIPRMGWAGRDSVWVERMPRKQDRADLLIASVISGQGRVLLTDTDSAYVEAVNPEWVNGGKQLLWMSDRNGWRQVYLYNRDGSLVRQLTKDGVDVREIAGIDEKHGVVYIKAAAPDPTQAQIFRYPLNGSGGRQLTKSAGTYTMSLAPGGRFAALTRSSLNVPPMMTLYELPAMRPMRLMGDNNALLHRIDSLNLAAATFLRIPSADGVTMLDAYRIVPPNFDSTKKYPVLMYTYGGPAAAQVLDTWMGPRYMFHQMLAQRGYVIVVADNRGAAWRGTHFRKMTQYKLGITESDDQIAVARWIGTQSWGDASRIGIWGWSYGGYNTAMSAFRGGKTFKMAIAVAPVSDWRFYDTIYTERFMWVPDENADGYTTSSALTYANGLAAKFLLIFGTDDDNVHPQNSYALAQKLQLLRKPFVSMFFPNKTHSISGPGGTLAVYDLIERFITENL